METSSTLVLKWKPPSLMRLGSSARRGRTTAAEYEDVRAVLHPLGNLEDLATVETGEQKKMFLQDELNELAK